MPHHGAAASSPRLPTRYRAWMIGSAHCAGGARVLADYADYVKDEFNRADDLEKSRSPCPDSGVSLRQNPFDGTQQVSDLVVIPVELGHPAESESGLAPSPRARSDIRPTGPQPDR